MEIVSVLAVLRAITKRTEPILTPPFAEFDRSTRGTGVPPAAGEKVLPTDSD